jgi:uncharacterized protein (TIGR02246 family)
MNDVSSERTDFIAYPTNCVVGTVRDADTARTAIDALLQGGFDREDIDILHGEKDLQRLDPAEHGFLAQFQRTLIRTFELEEFKHLTHHLEDVRAGRFVIMVRTKRRVQRIMAADILNRYGAEFVGFYGRWAWEDLSAAPHNSPEDIPASFARAWNHRDPDALASLFDEDAEFVNVTGVCWHDRESIRRAHTGRSADTLTLEAGTTKVKRLSPDVAVVHARMTLSSETQPGPRTTIVSFVVHRIGERWLCASVHNTDVIPEMTTPVIDETGAFRAPDHQSGQVS